MKIKEILTELTPRDTFKINMSKWHSPKVVEKWLESNGHEFLGSGAFGRVLGIPDDDLVVKVTTREDKCWSYYVNWCSKNEDNPHIPKIKSFVTHKNRDNIHRKSTATKFHIAVMEKLSSVPRRFWIIRNLSEEKDIPNFLLAYFILYPFDPGVFQYNLRSTELVQNDSTLMAMHDKELMNHMLDIFSKSDAGRAYRALTNLVKRVNCFADLHDGNILYRPSTDSLVIVDPVANYSEIEIAQDSKLYQLRFNKYQQARHTS